MSKTTNPVSPLRVYVLWKPASVCKNRVCDDVGTPALFGSRPPPPVGGNGRSNRREAWWLEPVQRSLGPLKNRDSRRFSILPVTAVTEGYRGGGGVIFFTCLFSIYRYRRDVPTERKTVKHNFRTSGIDEMCNKLETKSFEMSLLKTYDNCRPPPHTHPITRRLPDTIGKLFCWGIWFRECRHCTRKIHFVLNYPKQELPKIEK